jgi:hypothetical protein
MAYHSQSWGLPHCRRFAGEPNGPDKTDMYKWMRWNGLVSGLETCNYSYYEREWHTTINLGACPTADTLLERCFGVEAPGHVVPPANLTGRGPTAVLPLARLLRIIAEVYPRACAHDIHFCG